mmetsp:Transcript_22954/g.35918  ORF Transcript_22954/g.35918 Transcript_22954/m.35918 type:complete len:84 (-) Transcript_22954:255-506(-)
MSCRDSTGTCESSIGPYIDTMALCRASEVHVAWNSLKTCTTSIACDALAIDMGVSPCCVFAFASAPARSRARAPTARLLEAIR